MFITFPGRFLCGREILLVVPQVCEDGRVKLQSMGYLLDTIQSRIERRPDVLESELWDAEGQKLSRLALVRFVDSELRCERCRKRW